MNSILLIATVQLIWLEIAPYAVINEAVSQAKLFINEKQSRLVNAILRKIIQNKKNFLILFQTNRLIYQNGFIIVGNPHTGKKTLTRLLN